MWLSKEMNKIQFLALIIKFWKLINDCISTYND